MINLIAVDLTKKEQIDKLIAVSNAGKEYRETIEAHVKDGRTSMVFDLKTGDVVLAVQNGELLYNSNENVTINSII